MYAPEHRLQRSPRPAAHQPPPPPNTCRHTTQAARHRRHADYGRSGTIEGPHSTEPPTRACVQTGGATTTGDRDPGTPGVTCRERSHTQPHQYGGGGQPAGTTPRHRTPTQGANPEPHTKPATSNTNRRVRAGSTAGNQPGDSNTGPPGATLAPWHTCPADSGPSIRAAPRPPHAGTRRYADRNHHRPALRHRAPPHQRPH